MDTLREAPWVDVFRDGLCPLLDDRHLAALADALECNDPRLIQGYTTDPCPWQGAQDFPAEGACLIGFCAFADGLTTVQAVQDYFAESCYRIDMAMGEPAACRWLLNWFDNASRDEMRAALLAEVRFEQERRRAGARAAAALRG